MFTDEDYADAIAWQTVQDDRCPGCGQPRSESMHPDNDDAYEAKAWVCHACAAKTRKADAIADQGGPKTLGHTYLTTHLDQ